MPISIKQAISSEKYIQKYARARAIRRGTGNVVDLNYGKAIVVRGEAGPATCI